MQLYSALDNASTIIALLSPDYITSQVCQEEYNLALMKHIAAVSSINLVYKREALQKYIIYGLEQRKTWCIGKPKARRVT